ncbi:unnamed protein product [Clavelina lepadiformis]|uniref:Uncharacterized protein n=1 Tax=Clavelina lepadiformis TaxID=159417 RepID=A0ABP0GGY7_CLALP
MSTIGPFAPPPPSYNETLAGEHGIYNPTYFSGDATQPAQYTNYQPASVTGDLLAVRMAQSHGTTTVANKRIRRQASNHKLILAVFVIIVIITVITVVTVVS